MALRDFLFDNDAALREAERLLREQEDRVFRVIGGEDGDLALHVRADISRFGALNARQRLAQARQDSKADRMLFVNGLGFLLVLAKLFGGVDFILKGLSQL